MNESRPAALIAIDWGTTSARAYRLGATGEVLATHSAPLGIQTIRNAQFRPALDALLADWRDDPAPRLACGMIGSRQGWVEAPYVDCPAGLSQLAGMLTPTPGGELAIVPGARCADATGVPDVMRGEETQLAGALCDDAPRMLAVLPGTHSKWALVERGVLVDFATYMTGELYAILLDHSILGRMASNSAGMTSAGRTVFTRGVARGLAADGFAHAIFGARTLALAGDLAAEEVGDWLSGVLIGDEIRAARSWARERGGGTADVRVIGDDTIVARYMIALGEAGVRAEAGPAAVAAQGLFRIARQAGMLAA